MLALIRVVPSVGTEVTVNVNWSAVFNSPVFQRGSHRGVLATEKTTEPPNQETSQ